MTPHATLARLREYMVGPSRFMSLLSSFELGLIDTLRAQPASSAAQLAEKAGTKPDAVEQLLFLLVKEGFVAHDEEAGTYTLDALADVPVADLDRALAYMNLIKVTALRQLFYLTESARTGTVVGLKELYGAEGTLYDAVADHQDLNDSWLKLMNNVTANIDPWFFDNIDIPAGSRVLDVAGNTGLGAIHTYRHKASEGLTVTTFDLPDKRERALANFRAEGLQDHLSFIGGNVFDEIPRATTSSWSSTSWTCSTRRTWSGSCRASTSRSRWAARSTSSCRSIPRTSRTPTTTTSTSSRPSSSAPPWARAARRSCRSTSAGCASAASR